MNVTTIACPTCRGTLRTARPPSGNSQVRCPHCGTAFVLPAAGFKSARAAVESLARRPVLDDSSDGRAGARAPVPPLLSKSLGLALVGAVLLVGAGIIAAVLVTRSGPAPETVVKVEPAPERKAAPDSSEKLRLEREKRRPEYTRWMIQAGIAVNAKRFEEAVGSYGEALKLFPDDADALRGLSDARVALATQARDKQGSDDRQVGFTRFMEQGKEAMTAKQYAAAVRAFQQAVQLLPADAGAASALTEAQAALAADETQKQKLAAYQTHMAAGQAALVATRYGDAAREFTAALAILPGDAAALQGKRLVEGQLGALQDQEKRKTEYARLLDQGATGLKNQRFQDAIDSFTAALKLFRGDPAAARGLADAQQALNTLQAEFTRQMLLGDAAMRNNRYADAVAVFREAVRLNPANALANAALQNAQAALNNANAAQVATAQAAYAQLMNQGAAALATRRFADAVQAYTAALQLIPNDPTAVQGLRDAQAALDLLVLNRAEFDRELRLGTTDLKQQRYRDAIRHFRRALELRPEEPVALRGLRQARYGDAMTDGRAAMVTRRYNDAIRSFEEALREAPGDPAATAALQQARMLNKLSPTPR